MSHSPRVPWVLAGLAAGVAGVAVSQAVATAIGVRQSPVVAVGETIIALVPGDVAEKGIQALGHADKPVLVTGIVAGLLGAFVLAGLLARRSWRAGLMVYGVLAAVGCASALVQSDDSGLDLIPVLVGLGVWLSVFAWLAAPLRVPDPPARDTVLEEHPETHHAVAVGSTSRRGFLVRVGTVVLGTVGFVALGQWLGRAREEVEAQRALIRLDGVTEPVPPRGVRVAAKGVTPWVTDNDDFYQVHTVITVPTIDPTDWSLRIHGLVDREVVFTYQELLDRAPTEAWITLGCVSNPVGGDLIGNAWWSGVRVADLLAQAGVQDGADAVLQTSHDGWTCSTPLVALTDARNALLAVAMNGEPLPIAHGFPVRTIVPGLFGYVSACKWVVDLEVTRFADVAAYWTERGWAELGPVKLASRIDVPASGDTVPTGGLRVGGVAWCQHTGIQGVQVSLDDGPWRPVEIGHVPTNDTWVQWATTMPVGPGDHQLRVRAVNKLQEIQTGATQDVTPDGATGWHTVDFVAEDES